MLKTLEIGNPERLLLNAMLQFNVCYPCWHEDSSIQTMLKIYEKDMPYLGESVGNDFDFNAWRVL